MRSPFFFCWRTADLLNTIFMATRAHVSSALHGTVWRGTSVPNYRNMNILWGNGEQYWRRCDRTVCIVSKMGYDLFFDAYFHSNHFSGGRCCLRSSVCVCVHWFAGYVRIFALIHFCVRVALGKPVFAFC